ncbi:aromatic-ring-hydroxylating dioxygenase subunit beta [Microbacterium sp. NPDC076911]|uniref:aromatic-ring-hydroxylating dioxygenase subunit beta n=1 Tax=Microbacterium sp. NPDC076911 TaxID=3154958 RepID=UPI003434C069
MSSPLYRTPDSEVTVGIASVRDRYDGLRQDVEDVRGAPGADARLSADVAQWLYSEARLLDNERWEDWAASCCDETILWVPIDSRTPNPGSDQALFLDDRRRLDERIWRFLDPNAWAVVPGGQVVRSVTRVEAWLDAKKTDEVLVSSCLSIQHVRNQSTFSTAGHQVHRLRRATDNSWTLIQKTLLLPQLAAGTPHLGWLM